MNKPKKKKKPQPLKLIILRSKLISITSPSNNKLLSKITPQRNYKPIVNCLIINKKDVVGHVLNKDNNYYGLNFIRVQVIAIEPSSCLSYVSILARRKVICVGETFPKWSDCTTQYSDLRTTLVEICPLFRCHKVCPSFFLDLRKIVAPPLGLVWGVVLISFYVSSQLSMVLVKVPLPFSQDHCSVQTTILISVSAFCLSLFMSLWLDIVVFSIIATENTYQHVVYLNDVLDEGLFLVKLILAYIRNSTFIVHYLGLIIPTLYWRISSVFSSVIHLWVLLSIFRSFISYYCGFTLFSCPIYLRNIIILVGKLKGYYDIALGLSYFCPGALSSLNRMVILFGIVDSYVFVFERAGCPQEVIIIPNFVMSFIHIRLYSIYSALWVIAWYRNEHYFRECLSSNFGWIHEWVSL